MKKGIAATTRGITLAALMLMLFATAQALAPATVNYQGYLTDTGGAPLDATVPITFRIYSEAEGGAALWTELHSNVNVAAGLFEVLLGETSPLSAGHFADDSLWLAVVIGDDSEMTPRTLFSSVPFAYRVATVDDALGGTITSDLIVNTKINAGSGNSNSGAYSSVFGQNNFANEDFTFVGGGTNNSSGGSWGVIGGGEDNSVNVEYGIVGGGLHNEADNYAASVLGGEENVAHGQYATIGGGSFNSARGDLSFVGGGGGAIAVDSNSAIGVGSVIVGGKRNRADGDWGAIGGGVFNITTDLYATVAGGYRNRAYDDYATTGGGNNNISWDAYSTTAGGLDNNTSGLYGTVSGGDSNHVYGDWGVVGGGQDNVALYNYSTVCGGDSNQSWGDYSVVGGGYDNATNGQYAVTGGGHDNNSNSEGSTVSGGAENTGNGLYSVISGGFTNSISSQGSYATIGGGSENEANQAHATVGGGHDNRSMNNYSTIAGGQYNTSSGIWSTTGGGRNNFCSGDYAVVPGGRENSATGPYSFAGGRLAKASHTGSFVWAGSTTSTDTTFSFNSYSFTARCPNGARFYTTHTGIATGVQLSAGGGSWSNLCDVHRKNLHGEASTSDILQKVSTLPLHRWSYKSQDESIQHIGPTAQDFYAAFGLGESDTTINTLDPDGIALAAIQELYKQNQELKAELTLLRSQVQSLSASENQTQAARIPRRARQQTSGSAADSRP